MCKFNRWPLRLLLLLTAGATRQTANAAGALLVSSPNEGAVRKYDPKTGASLGYFVPPGLGGLKNTIGLAVGPDGNLYVASNGTSTIKRYNGITGAYMGDFVPAGNAGVAQPIDIRFGPDHNL